MGSIQVAKAKGLQARNFGDLRADPLTISNSKKKSFPSSEVRIKSAETSSVKTMTAKRAVRFKPCIDIHKGKVKQIVGSTLHDSNGENSTLITNFESEMSSAEFAKLYKSDGLLGGHIIMLGADSESISAAFEALCAYPGGLQVGGDINGDNARMYLEAGASHVIVTSIPVTYGGGATSIEDLDRIREAGAGCVDVTVGSALDIFGGSLPYKEVVSWHEKQQIGLEV